MISYILLSLLISNSLGCHHSKSSCCPPPKPACCGGSSSSSSPSSGGGKSSGGGNGGSYGGGGGAEESFTFGGSSRGSNYLALASPESKGYPSISAINEVNKDYDYAPAPKGDGLYEEPSAQDHHEPGPAPAEPPKYANVPKAPAPVSQNSGSGWQKDSVYADVGTAPAPPTSSKSKSSGQPDLSGFSLVPVQVQPIHATVAKGFRLVAKPGFANQIQEDPSAFNIENYDLVPLNQEDGQLATDIKGKIKGARLVEADVTVINAQEVNPQLIAASDIPGLEQQLAEANGKGGQSSVSHSATNWNPEPILSNNIETQNSVTEEISRNAVENTQSASAQECRSINCDFENSDLCNYSNLEEEGSEMLERWEVAEGRFHNSVTGVPKSSGGSYYAAAYVGNGDIAAFVANVDVKQTRQIRFNFFEASDGISLRACCSTLTFCDFETQVTNVVDDRKWNSGAINCPGGTDKIYFLCESALGHDGACAIDDISLRSPTNSDNLCLARRLVHKARVL